MKNLAAGLIACLLHASVMGADWPRWRGPQCNGISQESGWLDHWPKDGPPVAWKASVGIGFSSMAVAEGRLFTMGYVDGKDTVHCFDAVTGKPLWSHSYEAELGDLYFEGGTTCTPTVHGNEVYTLSRWGDLFCFQAATGKVLWSKNLKTDHNVRVPTWGFAGSPLIHQQLVIMNVGKAGMALDRTNGKLAWNSTVDDEAGYSSPVPFQRGQEWYALFSSGKAYSAVSLQAGKVLWDYRWITRYGVNAADPIVADKQVFISTGYDKGCSLLNVDGGTPKEVWRNKNMRNQCNPSVLVEGFLYGIDGDTTQAATLQCLDLQSGEVRWTQESVGFGAVMAAAGKLIVLSERGELLVAPASPKEFKPTAQAKVLEGKCWTVPVLANGRIYCRSAAGDVVCVDVRLSK